MTASLPCPRRPRRRAIAAPACSPRSPLPARVGGALALIVLVFALMPAAASASASSDSATSASAPRAGASPTGAAPIGASSTGMPPTGALGHASWAGATWRWPVDAPIAVVADYRAGDTVYSAGHRGIDLAATEGAPVFAPADGVVAFSGWVGDRTLVTVDHGGGVVSTLEPVTPSVRVGEPVAAGQPLGDRAAGGHCADCLHLGVRVDGWYVSPLLFLGGVPRAVLLPID